MRNKRKNKRRGLTPVEKAISATFAIFNRQFPGTYGMNIQDVIKPLEPSPILSYNAKFASYGPDGSSVYYLRVTYDFGAQVWLTVEISPFDPIVNGSACTVLDIWKVYDENSGLLYAKPDLSDLIHGLSASGII